MADISALVILNSRSGNGSQEGLTERLQTMATHLGVRCDIASLRTSSEIFQRARLAARSSYDIVIAGGGDGTINAVASELIGTGKRLGVLPLGTFNYFAREMGVPTDIEEAFKTCFAGDIRKVSVGEVNGRMFLNNASIGLYPAILSVREKTYQRWGRTRFAAYWAVFTALLRLHVNMQLTITWNGQRHSLRTPLLFVARNGTQLDEFRVPGVRCVTEDGFSVYALRSLSKLRLLRVAWRALRGKLEPDYDFEMVCTSTLRVESPRILRTMALDGERVKVLAPLQFQVRQDALSILIPQKRERVAV